MSDCAEGDRVRKLATGTAREINAKQDLQVACCSVLGLCYKMLRKENRSNFKKIIFNIAFSPTTYAMELAAMVHGCKMMCCWCFGQ